MFQPLYQVEFLGGPSDGAVVTLGDLSCQRTICLPMRPISISPEGEPDHLTLDDARSVYRLSRKALTTSNGGTTLHYEYVFAGFKTSRDQARKTDPPRAMIGPLAVFLRRYRNRAVRWMLAPVDHPLKLAK